MLECKYPERWHQNYQRTRSGAMANRLRDFAIDLLAECYHLLGLGAKCARRCCRCRRGSATARNSFPVKGCGKYTAATILAENPELQSILQSLFQDSDYPTCSELDGKLRTKQNVRFQVTFHGPSSLPLGVILVRNVETRKITEFIRNDGRTTSHHKILFDSIDLSMLLSPPGPRNGPEHQQRIHRMREIRGVEEERKVSSG
jgi:hypothetical protein